MKQVHFCIQLIIIILTLPVAGFSQKINFLETSWQDSFNEWTIHTEGDSIEGKLFLTWELSNDWTVWQMDLGAFNASLKLKYTNNPELWEFRSGNEIITAKTVWSNDYSEWRFTDGKSIIKLKSKYMGMPVIWFSEGEEHGYIDIFMEDEEDPNFWIIEDELDDNISLLYKSALIFISIYHSTPKIK